MSGSLLFLNQNSLEIICFLFEILVPCSFSFAQLEEGGAGALTVSFYLALSAFSELSGADRDPVQGVQTFRGTVFQTEECAPPNSDPSVNPPGPKAEHRPLWVQRPEDRGFPAVGGFDAPLQDGPTAYMCWENFPGKSKGTLLLLLPG